MKFESKFGLGEVCIYNENKGETREMLDEFVKVVGVNFCLDGSTSYLVEWLADNRTIQRVHISESQLTGDPDYNQEKGCYEN